MTLKEEEKQCKRKGKERTEKRESIKGRKLKKKHMHFVGNPEIPRIASRSSFLLSLSLSTAAILIYPCTPPIIILVLLYRI